MRYILDPNTFKMNVRFGDGEAAEALHFSVRYGRMSRTAEESECVIGVAHKLKAIMWAEKAGYYPLDVSFEPDEIDYMKERWHTAAADTTDRSRHHAAALAMTAETELYVTPVAPEPIPLLPDNVYQLHTAA